MTNAPNPIKHLLTAMTAAALTACGASPETTDPSADTAADLAFGAVEAPSASSAQPTSTTAPATEEGPAATAPAEPEDAPEADGAPVGSVAASSAGRALLARLGLPARFAVGLGNDAYASGDAAKAHAYGVPGLDLHYMYLSGLDWPSWTVTPGAYVTQHAEAARAHGVVPMFTLYQAAAWGEAKLGNFADRAFMTRYWAGARTMFEKLGAFDAPAVVHLEPDLWGYAQKAAPADDPSRVPMKVGSIVPECKDLPEDVSGMGKCLVRLARTLSPKVAVGLSASTFGATTNGKSDPARVASFLAKIGAAESDLVVVETLDRDAGCFEAAKDPLCKRAGTFTWDETNATHPSFHDHLAWAKTIGEVTGKPLLWWQMPLGVPGASAGSAGRYRDNRVRYLFSHPEEFVAAGGVGAVFGTGAPNQTTPLTDGGQFARAVAGYAASPTPLP